MASSRALQTPEILLLILVGIDGHAVLALRLTHPRINFIIVAHQKFIFNSVASREYSFTLNLATSEIPHVSDIFYLKALVRLPKARLLAVRGVAKPVFHMFGVPGIPADHPAGDVIRTRCARGTLLVWALVDIQRSVDHCGPIPKYVPPAPARSRRRRIIARLFRPHNTADPALIPKRPIDSVPNFAFEVRNHSAMVDAAQQPFVAVLDRDSRVDMEIARSNLCWLLQFDMSGCFGGPGMEYREKSWWKENWALRQGPEFVLAVSSSDPKERDWALDRMDAEWSVRPKAVVEAERITPVFLFDDTENPKNQGFPISTEANELKKRALHVYLPDYYPAV